MNKFLLSRVCMFVIAICTFFALIPSTTCQAIATTGIVNLPGAIQFVGTVQSITLSSITVAMPDGQKLSMNIVQNQTNLADFKGALPTIGQIVKATAAANPDGSFTASELGLFTPDTTQEPPTVSFQGITTSTVGADNKLNFKVGTMSFSFPIGSTADLQDFNSNVHAIGPNILVKAEVLFTGTAGTVVSIQNGND